MKLIEKEDKYTHFENVSLIEVQELAEIREFHMHKVSMTTFLIMDCNRDIKMIYNLSGSLTCLV